MLGERGFVPSTFLEEITQPTKRPPPLPAAPPPSKHGLAWADFIGLRTSAKI